MKENLQKREKTIPKEPFLLLFLLLFPFFFCPFFLFGFRCNNSLHFWRNKMLHYF